MKTVLIVDDDSMDIKTMGDILKPYYKVRASNSVEGAFKVLEKFDDIELIVLDIIMPFITGYDMLEDLKRDKKYKHIPVILVTAMSDVMDEYRGFELGASDYIRKPVVPSVLLARVNNHIKNSDEKSEMHRLIKDLETQLDENEIESSKFKDVIMTAIFNLAHIGDTESVNHISHTKQIVKLIAEQLFADKRFSFELDEDEIDRIVNAVPYHDIGKVGIHDNIMTKKGKYTLEEFSIIQKHTTLGYEAMEKACEELGVDPDSGYIQTAIDIAHYHHERWNGSGYPEGLEGYEIPLAARIMQVADVYDAMVTHRDYNKTYSPEEARDIIVEGRNRLFDPEIVDAFVKCFDRIKRLGE